jgi:hypothetical protein
VSSPIWGLIPDLYYCQTFAVLAVWGALSDERTLWPLSYPGSYVREREQINEGSTRLREKYEREEERNGKERAGKEKANKERKEIKKKLSQEERMNGRKKARDKEENKKAWKKEVTKERNR